MKITLFTTLLIWPFFLPGVASSSIQFEEVTGQTGINYIGESWGIAWGDYNGDGLPDIWSGNHRSQPSLYVNNGDGTFTDVLPGLFVGNPYADTHGAAWADFDNDGDQDLIEVTGGSTSTNINHFNHLYENDGGNLTDVAVQLGVDYPENRGRTPLWLDYNNDALLDLVIAGAPRDGVGPSRIFKQTGAGFSDTSAESGFNCIRESSLALLSDLSGNGFMNLICHEWSFPQKVYDISNPIFSDITTLIPTIYFVEDVVTADFNGDLLPDIFTARFPHNPSNSIQLDTHTVESRIGTPDVERGFSFTTFGNLSLDISTPYLQEGFQQGSGFVIKEIYIGETGWNPPRYGGRGVARTVFSISSDDTSVHGLKPRQPDSENGLYLGYDPDEGKWTAILIGGQRYQSYWARMESENPVTDITHIGYDPSSSNMSPVLYLNSGSGFIDTTDASGLSAPVNCLLAAAGDFDNDMDLDIYMACQHVPENIPNILFENGGNGNFTAVPDAGGASGSPDGGANNVAIADYDMDGFLDLYVVNGSGEPPLNDGPDQLFHNLGNDNHWIEIDLEGVDSNRDGIGTRILLTAGGVTQLREQNGGIHNAAQNHTRLHFGLGNNTSIEKIVLEWPGGVQQTLTDIHVDQVLRVTEDVANFSPTITGTPDNTVLQDTPYSFTPSATDQDAEDTLIFSITNKPDWASFDTSTGSLSGIPGNIDVGTITGIVITVDDQQDQSNSKASLSAFSLMVYGLDSNNNDGISDTPATATDTNSGSSGGGCTLNIHAKSDLTLPLLIVISIACLSRRRRIWGHHMERVSVDKE